MYYQAKASVRIVSANLQINQPGFNRKMDQSNVYPTGPVFTRKVLIVDDQPEVRLLMRVALRKNYELIEAANGVDALQEIDRHHPKLIMLDIMMPGEMDGLQVLDVIKADQKFKHIVVCMITARGQTADGIEAIKRGADGYFIKPFSPREVFDWVDSKLR